MVKGKRGSLPPIASMRALLMFTTPRSSPRERSNDITYGTSDDEAKI